MQVSPATQSAAKATRAKVKDADAQAAAPKKSSRSRKKSPEPTTVQPEVEVIAMHPSPHEVSGMIATAAYFIAAERHFSAGHELDDWLEAERRVRAQLP